MRSTRPPLRPWAENSVRAAARIARRLSLPSASAPAGAAAPRRAGTADAGVPLMSPRRVSSAGPVRWTPLVESRHALARILGAGEHHDAALGGGERFLERHRL